MFNIFHSGFHTQMVQFPSGTFLHDVFPKETLNARTNMFKILTNYTSSWDQRESAPPSKANMYWPPASKTSPSISQQWPKSPHARSEMADEAASSNSLHVRPGSKKTSAKLALFLRSPKTVFGTTEAKEFLFGSPIVFNSLRTLGLSGLPYQENGEPHRG